MSEVLTSDRLNDVTGVRHGFFPSVWGDGGYPKDGSGRGLKRDAMALKLGVPGGHLVSCYQDHTADVVTVTDVWGPSTRPRGDAMVTDRVGVALGILTADCVPVLLADARAGVIGAAHAGWRGALSGIIENSVAAMERMGATRKSIVAALGPAIGWRSYEVGPEFPAPFMAEDPAHERFFRIAPKTDHFLFDLTGYVEGKLRAFGIDAVDGSPADTCAEPSRFFSHRHSCLTGVARGGNLLSAIVRIA